MLVTIKLDLNNPETAREDLALALEDLVETINIYGLDDTELASITGEFKGQMTVEDI